MPTAIYGMWNVYIIIFILHKKNLLKPRPGSVEYRSCTSSSFALHGNYGFIG